MSGRPAHIIQADVARIIRAVTQTGARMRIDIHLDGSKISLVPIGPEGTQPRLTASDLAPEQEIML
jgi:hypothetical protein